MRITDSGRHLSPWRRTVLPGLMAALRAVVAFLVLRGPVDTLLHNELFLRGLAPHWAQVAAGVALALSGAAFVWPPSVVWGGLLAIAGLAAFEYRWRMIVPIAGSTFLSAAALIGVMCAGAWLSRRVQRRVYGTPGR